MEESSKGSACAIWDKGNTHVDYIMHILPHVQKTQAQWIDLGRGRQKDVEWA